MSQQKALIRDFLQFFQHSFFFEFMWSNWNKVQELGKFVLAGSYPVIIKSWNTPSKGTHKFLFLGFIFSNIYPKQGYPTWKRPRSQKAMIENRWLNRWKVGFGEEFFHSLLSYTKVESNNTRLLTSLWLILAATNPLKLCSKKNRLRKCSSKFDQLGDDFFQDVGLANLKWIDFLEISRF